ncbi:MAG TPA: XdhC family protein, partial [Saprospiraceae bacterium]|nr:XdhC family protein [Saprospiraceae bacterium]
MKDFKSISAAFKKIDFSQRKAALATVVKVRGSSYRSPGARMLISDDGHWVGSISGGCLEGDALRKARKVMMDQMPMMVTYDTREKSNQNLGIGLGCNGVIDVLIEPIDPSSDSNPIQIIDRLTGHEEPIALATVFSGSAVGQKIALKGNQVITQSVEDKKLSQNILIDLEHTIQSGKSEAKSYGDGIEVFLEVIQPTISLLIFGGGFDARPVSEMAKTLGWNVSITDECVAHIAPVFFPNADQLTLCQRNFIDREFHITAYTACVLMSHNYEYDRDVLKKIIGTPTPYIGILGPRKRFDKMLDELSNEGIHFKIEDHQRIHSPIGLDIGAETPQEIALSIIGEINGKFSGRSGSFLKDRTGPIHARGETDD